MSRISILALVVAAGLTQVGRMAAQAPPQQSPPATQAAASGEAEEGRKLYTAVGCYQCHGYEGQGAVTGPRLGPDPLPLAAFRSYVRRPAGQMPLYGARILSDADLGKIHAYLESRPAPPSVESLPLLTK